MALLLHILFLRPTIAQLKEINGDSWEPLPTLVKQGWTAFLEELAGPTMFDELQKEPVERTQWRKQLMRQMYYHAGLEEAYLAGRLDKNHAGKLYLFAGY